FHDDDVRFNQLLRLWNVSAAQDEVDCRALRINDLRCLSGHGSLAALERLGRPAILILAHAGQRRRVLLSHLSDDTAILIGSAGTYRVAKRHLSQLWTGAFEMVWRAHAGVRTIRNGMIGDAVVWLRRQLTRAEGLRADDDSPVGRDSLVFDDRLEERVRR